MLVQFGDNWIQKIPLTAKLEFFSSNYFQIGQHVVLLHVLIRKTRDFSMGLPVQ